MLKSEHSSWYRLITFSFFQFTPIQHFLSISTQWSMDFFHSDAFQNYVRKLLKQHDVPGLSIGIIHHDQEATAGFGCATRFPERPCTPDTLFEIASCSKSLTAACIALLVEDEAHSEIRYDAIMHNLLPDFVMSQQEHTVLVTLDDVLGHHTGMAPYVCR